MNNILKNILTINTKRGAMFGIDARVTLAVTAIAAFIVGFNQFTDLDRISKKQADIDLKIIRNAFENHYKENYTVPATVGDLVNDGYLSLDEGEFDPWGSSYIIGFVSENKTIKESIMNIKYVYLLSLGKNAVRDTAAVASVANWDSLVVAGDDVLIKFDTYSLESEIADIESSQIQVVKKLLENYVFSKQAENQIYCSNTDHQKQSNCDVNGDDVYSLNEELLLNYMPKDVDDTNSKYYLTINGVHGTENKFKPGYINTVTNFEYNMYTFMTLIGGLSDYVKSPRGLVLHFDSNKYNNTESPYHAEIWYDNEVTIF